MKKKWSKISQCGSCYSRSKLNWIPCKFTQFTFFELSAWENLITQSFKNVFYEIPAVILLFCRIQYTWVVSGHTGTYFLLTTAQIQHLFSGRMVNIVTVLHTSFYLRKGFLVWVIFALCPSSEWSCHYLDRKLISK